MLTTRTKTRIKTSSKRTGAMLVLVAVCLPVLLVLVAYAIQTTYHQLTRTELRTVVDSSAEAAARVLGKTGNQADAIQAARDAASRNLVGGESCTLEDTDIEFGVVVRSGANSRFEFTPTTFAPTAVRVTIGELRQHAFPVLSDSLTVQASATAGQTDRDIVLVLDRSGSMAAVNDDGSSSGWTTGLTAPSTSRWATMVQAANQFLDELDSTPSIEKVALVTYNGSAYVDNDLIVDYQTIRDSINSHTAAFEGGATDIAAGIETARATLLTTASRSWAAKTIVVMTDGIHTSGSTSPADSAENAAGLGMTVHTLTYGNDADVTQMEEVAERGRGSHWHAQDSAALQTAFQEIANTVPTMLME